jgi:hypothetical protein
MTLASIESVCVIIEREIHAIQAYESADTEGKAWLLVFIHYFNNGESITVMFQRPSGNYNI